MPGVGNVLSGVSSDEIVARPMALRFNGQLPPFCLFFHSANTQFSSSLSASAAPALTASFLGAFTGSSLGNQQQSSRNSSSVAPDMNKKKLIILRGQQYH